MDFVVYLLCYALEIKDKPRERSRLAAKLMTDIIPYRTAWNVPGIIIHHPNTVGRTRIWPEVGFSCESPVNSQVELSWYSRRLYDQCTRISTTSEMYLYLKTSGQAVYAIIATTSGNLTPLYPALIISLANSAPYFTNLTVTSSTRLLQLFTSFSAPLFLLADEGHPRLLFFM